VSVWLFAKHLSRYNTPMSILLLRQIPLFTSLPDAELQHLLDVLHPLELPVGSTLFKEDDPGEHFYLVLDGVIDILKSIDTHDERLIAQRKAGEYLGEMSLLNPDGLRTATARATANAQLLVLTRQDFNDLLNRRPSLAYDMVRRMSLRLRDSQDEAMAELAQTNQELREAYDELKAAHLQIVEKEKLQQELKVARQVQASFMPRQLPQLPGWQFAAFWQPAREVSGDFYDFFPMQNNQLGIVIADVTDKGTPAALFMALSRSTLRASLTRAPALLEGLQQANQLITADSPDSMFVTVIAATLEPATGQLTYINAGHNPPLYYNAAAGTFQWLDRRGIPLGLDGDARYAINTLSMQSGDMLLLYTDGLPDAINAEEECFEMDRIQATFNANLNGTATGLSTALQTELARFVGGTLPYDDITVVVLKRS
jgi:phosphoserine phosphatase RsbU/P